MQKQLRKGNCTLFDCFESASYYTCSYYPLHMCPVAQCQKTPDVVVFYYFPVTWQKYLKNTSICFQSYRKTEDSFRKWQTFSRVFSCYAVFGVCIICILRGVDAKICPHCSSFRISHWKGKLTFPRRHSFVGKEID